MKSMKELFSEYGFLYLTIIPLFFVISYLFNVIYFFTFDVRLSQIPLAVSDYIMSINVLGTILSGGIILQTISALFGQYLGRKISLFKPDDDTSIKDGMAKIDKEIETIRNSNDTGNVKREKLDAVEVSLKKIQGNIAENKIIATKKSALIKNTFLLISLPQLGVFVWLVWANGIFSAHFFLLVTFGGYLAMCLLANYDSFTMWVALTIMVCLVYSSDNALKMALDNYQNDSVVISIANNKYFNMRSFENGFWVKHAENGEVLFITKSGEIINFHSPKRIVDHLSKKD